MALLTPHTQPPAFAVRLFLGLGFLAVGIQKFTRLEAFAKDVAAFKILPDYLEGMATYFVPSLEVVLGLALTLIICYRGALALLAGLLLTFIIAWISVLARGLDVHCGCLSGSFSLGPTGTLILDVVLVLLVLYLIFENRTWKKYTFGGSKLTLPE